MARSKARVIASWVLGILLALAFFPSGLVKLVGVQMAVDNFIRWGYPSWFRILTGLIEVGAAGLVLVPRTRLYGALLIVPTMVGAVFTHATHGEARMIVLPLTLLVMATALAILSRTMKSSPGAT
jgi:uncharacterized membrane protein YphA (DoxX/SURF4 family)